MNPPADPRDPQSHDDPMPGDDIDALVSAYLDGEATPDEMARVQDDPALRERLEQFRAVRDAVAGDIEAPTLLLDEQVSVALAGGREPRAAAASVESSSDGAGDDTRRPVDLSDARDRRRRTGSRMLGAVAAVAALVLLVASMPGLLGGGDDAGDNMAASIGSAEMADGSSDAEAEADFAADGAAADVADEALSTYDDASPAAPGTSLYRSNGEGDEAPLVILPLGSGLVDGDRADGLTVEQSSAPHEGGTDWPTDLGGFATRNEARSAVTARVAIVLAASAPPSTESFSPNQGEPEAAACLNEPPLRWEGLGLEDPDASVLFVGRFVQAGDERYVVVLRPAGDDSGARVFEIRAATCTLLGVQDL